MRPVVAALLGLAALATPLPVFAHGLATAYQSELPLAVYVAGAAAVVGLSFLFVLSRNTERPVPVEGRIEPVPAWIRLPLRVLGLIAWSWIVVQLIAGGSSDAEVATLFLWVYGWVGVAMLSALVGPVWRWLDPFTTLYDIGAWAGRRAGLSGLEPAPIPRALRGWPAVVGFVLVVWLELVLGASSQTLAIVLVGHTMVTLAMMLQFGRDPWRTEGETFGVWFGLLNRMAT